MGMSKWQQMSGYFDINATDLLVTNKNYVYARVYFMVRM